MATLNTQSTQRPPLENVKTKRAVLYDLVRLPPLIGCLVSRSSVVVVIAFNFILYGIFSLVLLCCDFIIPQIFISSK
jgi:hypothetical protein